MSTKENIGVVGAYRRSDDGLTERCVLGWQEFFELARASARRIEVLTFQIENGVTDRRTSKVPVRGGGVTDPTASEAMMRLVMLPRLEEQRSYHMGIVGRALAAIRRVRDALGNDEGEILEMFYIDGFLTWEIAGELGLTVDGVFYRKRKALRWMDENMPVQE